MGANTRVPGEFAYDYVELRRQPTDSLPAEIVGGALGTPAPSSSKGSEKVVSDAV